MVVAMLQVVVLVVTEHLQGLLVVGRALNRHLLFRLELLTQLQSVLVAHRLRMVFKD